MWKKRKRKRNRYVPIKIRLAGRKLPATVPEKVQQAAHSLRPAHLKVWGRVLGPGPAVSNQERLDSLHTREGTDTVK